MRRASGSPPQSAASARLASGSSATAAAPTLAVSSARASCVDNGATPTWTAPSSATNPSSRFRLVTNATAPGPAGSNGRTS
jgi:hypothetical protein